ncbi:hypothetical protein PPE_06125 [Paenibacillus polymyxa E681]|nr:hypothetical protein PPE_06125 [Paenibacillus polymyxa E681]
MPSVFTAEGYHFTPESMKLIPMDRKKFSRLNEKREGTEWK